MFTDHSVVSAVPSASRKSNESASTLDRAQPNQRGERIPEMATMDMQMAVPSLPDDSDIGVKREHVIQRDGERDLKFNGTLLASVAPNDAARGRWHELRVYQTGGGKIVFSQVGRSVLD